MRLFPAQITIDVDPGFWGGLMTAGGPFMMLIILMAVFQLIVIKKVEDKTARMVCLYVTVTIQFLAALSAIVVGLKEKGVF